MLNYCKGNEFDLHKNMQPIRHLGKYHNTLCLPPPPPPKFCISIVSSFSWKLQRSLEKTKAMLMQNLGEQTQSIMVFSEVAYFHLNGCAPGLALKLRHAATRKWAIYRLGVRVCTDQSSIVMVCERKFTVCHKVFSIKSRRVLYSMHIYQYGLCRSCSSP